MFVDVFWCTDPSDPERDAKVHLGAYDALLDLTDQFHIYFWSSSKQSKWLVQFLNYMTVNGIEEESFSTVTEYPKVITQSVWGVHANLAIVLTASTVSDRWSEASNVYSIAPS